MQTFTGLQYLKIDIASNFGLDKLDWDQRINWVDQNHANLESLLSEAETPALYHAGVQALRKTEAGQPTGYPISLDAASSGLQLLAVLVGCEASAKLCGVVSTGHREDAYKTIYNAMRETMDSNSGVISREDCKRAIMTSLYSSKAVPKEVFGEGALLETFFHTMEVMSPGAWNLNHALQTLWQPYALSHDWVLPDNFHVHIKNMSTKTEHVQFLNTPVGITLKVNQGTKEGRSISPNIIHSVDAMIVREMHRRCSYDAEQMMNVIQLLDGVKQNQGGLSTEREKDQLLLTLVQHHQDCNFLSARVLDLIDEHNINLVNPRALYSLVTSLPDKAFPVISIHDAFRVHPNYGNDIRRQYNRILYEISRSDLLSYIASQICGGHLPVNKLGDISEQILEADYALS